MAAIDNSISHDAAAPQAAPAAGADNAAAAKRPANPTLEISLLSLVLPGTKRFRRQHLAIAANDFKTRVSKFVALKTLPAETKRRLRPLAGRFARQLAEAEGWQVAGTFWATLLFIAPFVPALIYSLEYGFDRFYQFAGPGTKGADTLYAVIFLGGMVGWFVAFFWPLLLSANSVRFLAPTALLYVWPILILTAYGGVSYYLHTHFRPDQPRLWLYLLSALMQSAVFALYGLFAFAGGFAALMPLVHLFRQRKRRLYPQATIVDSLLTALSLLERHPTRWVLAEHKRQIVAALEEAAACMERDLFAELRAGDVASNIQVGSVIGQRAAALRELKRWALTPKPDTYENLRARVAEALVRAAEGHWDSLPAATPQKVSLAEGFTTRAGHTVRTLLAGALPIVILYAARRMGLPMEGQFGHYATIAAVLWSAITVVQIVNPQFRATLEAIQIAVNTWRGDGGQKKSGG